MAPKKTYLALCRGSSNNPCGTAEERVKNATSTAARYDTTAPNSKNEILILVEVLTNLGTTMGPWYSFSLLLKVTWQRI